MIQLLFHIANYMVNESFSVGHLFCVPNIYLHKLIAITYDYQNLKRLPLYVC